PFGLQIAQVPVCLCKFCLNLIELFVLPAILLLNLAISFFRIGQIIFCLVQVFIERIELALTVTESLTQVFQILLPLFNILIILLNDTLFIAYLFTGNLQLGFGITYLAVQLTGSTLSLRLFTLFFGQALPSGFFLFFQLFGFGENFFLFRIRILNALFKRFQLLLYFNKVMLVKRFVQPFKLFIISFSLCCFFSLLFQRVRFFT